MIIHALEGRPSPICDDGSNSRDRLNVSGHCTALMTLIKRGRIGETCDLGGSNERDNRDVVGLIREIIDRAFASDEGLTSRFPCRPAAAGRPCRSLIGYVTNRADYYHRYAINASKLIAEFGSWAEIGFENGLERTVQWYLDREEWWPEITDGSYEAWI
jgi:dTDP-glucose 4,6-dehydratase